MLFSSRYFDAVGSGQRALINTCPAPLTLPTRLVKKRTSLSLTNIFNTRNLCCCFVSRPGFPPFLLSFSSAYLYKHACRHLFVIIRNSGFQLGSRVAPPPPPSHSFVKTLGLWQT